MSNENDKKVSNENDKKSLIKLLTVILEGIVAAIKAIGGSSQSLTTIAIAIAFSVTLSTVTIMYVPQVQDALLGPQGEQGIQGVKGDTGDIGPPGPGLGELIFDSGWRAVEPGRSEAICILDDLNVFVYMIGRNEGIGKRIHQMYFGGDQDFTLTEFRGAYWSVDSNNQLWASRLLDSYWTEIRVLVWQLPARELNETTDQIKIGMLAREEKSLYMMEEIAWIAEDEINRYCEENGIPYRFEFLLDSTQGQAAVALEKVQSFKAMGIELVVAYLGPEYNFLLSYINDYSMAFIDAVNTMPEYTLPDDGLYRMHPTWAMQGYAVAENMWSLGKEAVIIIRQDSPYFDEIYDVFTTSYVAKGGDIFAEIVLPDPEVVEYSTFFVWLEEKINDAHAEYGECKVGIQLVAYTDFLSLFPYLQDYPTALNVIWFGNEALANQPTLFMYHPTTADRIKMLSPSPFIDVDCDMYHTFARAYSSVIGGVPSYEDCLVYDSCWVMAKSVIAAGSPDGDQVNPFVKTTSNNHQGVTGWCKLDANGDRALLEYDVWGYSIESDGFIALKYGYYTGETDTTTWLIELIKPP